MTAQLFFFLLILSISAKLPSFHLDPSLVTISGISSGGFMAVQMHFAYSSIIQGSAIIAGGPYGCALNNPAIALTACMSSPDFIPLKTLILTMEGLEKTGLIDPLGNIKNQKVYLFSGTEDTVVNSGVMKQLEAMYRSFGAQITTEFNISAEHSFPTENYGNLCVTLAEPYINNCNYNAAFEAFKVFYGIDRLKPPIQSLIENVISFDQSDYYSILSSFHSKGYLYLPESCRKGTLCGLHIALHGCEQTLNDISDTFVKHVGLNELAEANNFIVLYPQIERSYTIPFNPKGCWDWWGYSDLQLAAGRYLTKDGVQIDALIQMIKDLGINGKELKKT